MNERHKLWISVTVALWAGTGALGTAHAQTPDPSQAEAIAEHAAESNLPAPPEMGEGEGEGEGSSDGGDLATDDRAYLTRLGLIRGHLRAGNALYQAGHADMSATHMKHPRDELYSGLVPAIEARGGVPFDEALSDLADAVQSGADAASVQLAWEHVDAAIAALETRVDPSVDLELLGAADLLRTAGAEYAIGVVDGSIENVHEYQDAWGFTQVAGQRLANAEPTTDQEEEALIRARGLIAELEALWPSLVPEGTVDGSATALYGTAARIELAANALLR